MDDTTNVLKLLPVSYMTLSHLNNSKLKLICGDYLYHQLLDMTKLSKEQKE